MVGIETDDFYRHFKASKVANWVIVDIRNLMLSLANS